MRFEGNCMFRMGRLGCVAFLVLFAAMGMSSCSNIDCPLENKVQATYCFYDSETKKDALVGDTISIISVSNDSVLFNNGYNIRKISLPMSYMRSVDTLLVRISGDKVVSYDTLFISHSNEPYFESVDCSPAVFHVIKGIEYTTHDRLEGLTHIDSIKIANPKVNYNATENFKIYISMP